jgi:hypothetical protein
VSFFLQRFLSFPVSRSYHFTIDIPSSSKDRDPQTTRTGRRASSLPAGNTKDGEKSTTANAEKTQRSAAANVFYVAPADAKGVKMELESRGWLDKGFRMIKMSPETIAIPVTLQAWNALREGGVSSSDSWRSQIVGQGQEEMPYSTAKFAAKGKR